MFVKKVICPKIFSNACFSSLFKNIMSRKIPIWQKRLNEIKSQYGNQELTKIKVSQVFKGMEGLPIMLYSASVLNPKLVKIDNLIIINIFKRE